MTYEEFISKKFKKYLLKKATKIDCVKGLSQIGEINGLETSQSLQFLKELHQKTRARLDQVLLQRKKDRTFLDERIKVLNQFNKSKNQKIGEEKYKSVIGLRDGQDRIVIGPKIKKYFDGEDHKPISKIPKFLQGNHVTLFGPPQDAKMCINAMNSYFRKLEGEPEIIEELLSTQKNVPMWGADDEDSKTPLRSDLTMAEENLSHCFKGELSYFDKKRNKKYSLEKNNLARPIKRIPGLALPSLFLFDEKEMVPLHLYDFAIHFFHHYKNEEALAFYIPKLENEEEASYIHFMIESAEKMIQKTDPSYKLGTVKLLIVLENPRAIFRTNEIIDNLYPYFAGASLGWHDYLGATARLFKEDSSYRIPVKADPDIVIKYIKASHELLADVVGKRGGIKIGGMYGILPLTTEIMSDSFQVTILGYFKDVVTQLKRNLTGFWVAHPDFVRIGLAIVEAWKIYEKEKNDQLLKTLFKEFLNEKYYHEIIEFTFSDDIASLEKDDSRYDLALLAADIGESNIISNHDPKEVRYNVFQALQYFTDWLSGNGCVSLPAIINDTPIRVMDDLATAERSRWEVWHEIYHGRFCVYEFIKICFEEMNFIRRDLSDSKKIVQVKYTEKNAKWYDVSLFLMIKLMTDKNPCEFATELLLPFTIKEIRESSDPINAVKKIDSKKYKLNEKIERFFYYFEQCGCLRFAQKMSSYKYLDHQKIQKLILSFTKEEIIESASFHGDIGQSKKSLDYQALKEQSKVEDRHSIELGELGQKYREKFGIKFLISAKGKSGKVILKELKKRLNNTLEEELENARLQLLEITKKRINEDPLDFKELQVKKLMKNHQIENATFSVSEGGKIQSYFRGKNLHNKSLFQIASLSKTLASVFSIEFLKDYGIDIEDSVNQILKKYESPIVLKGKEIDKLKVKHLMNHHGLNLHYIKGYPINEKIPSLETLLKEIKLISIPGEKFEYSGGGFIVLQYIIELIGKKSVHELMKPFLSHLGLHNTIFEEEENKKFNYAKGQNIKGGRLKFPLFAAGAYSNAIDIAKFLSALTSAYHNIRGVSGISHETAIKVLKGVDNGSIDFIGGKVGLGCFIVEAGENEFILHQGANDGFRSIYLHCFKGPDMNKGLSVFCSGEENGLFFISELVQLILKEINFQGIKYKDFKKKFDYKKISKEKIINYGYKELFLNAFKKSQADKIKRTNRKIFLKNNLVSHSKILKVTNDKFARSKNALSKYEPVFDPEAFGCQGKIMDSWESARHSEKGFEELVFEIKKITSISQIIVSTKFHFGNQVEKVSLFGLKKDKWVSLLSEKCIKGHFFHVFNCENTKDKFKVFKLITSPDGGLSRLGLLEKKSDHLKSRPYKESIPKTLKPLTIDYKVDSIEVEKNISKVKEKEIFNAASLDYGAQIKYVSNDHYGDVRQILSPLKPLNMFDGFESARSRSKNHFEKIIIKFPKKVKVKAIEFDFSYFVNNNPNDIEVEGVLEKTNVKAFAGNKAKFIINNDEFMEELTVKVHPDGGFNRIKVFSVLS